MLLKQRPVDGPAPSFGEANVAVDGHHGTPTSKCGNECLSGL